MGAGDTLRSAYESASAASQRAATAVVNGATSAADATARGAMWVAQKEADAANWVADQSVKAAQATIAAGQKVVHDAMVGSARLLGKTINAAVYMECLRNKLVANRRFRNYQGKQIRVCDDGKGNQTAEVVERQPDGSYRVVGQIPPGPDGKFTQGDVWNPARTSANDPTFQPYTVPAPVTSHVNGINTSPAEGLTSALALQRELQGQCKDKIRANEAKEAKGKSCPGCDCVLYTYSENLGMGADLLQCAGAKLGWDGKVTGEEAQMMRDAIARDGHVSMSAHSRGSILTENAWDDVFDEQRARFMNDPGAIQAGNAATQQALANARTPEDVLGASIAGDVARRQWASQRAGAVMNQHVTVVTSGNAVSFPNPYQNGVRVISTAAGWPIDPVNLFTGSSNTGNMQTVRVEIPPTGPIVYADIKYHSFDGAYVHTVAANICARTPGGKP